MIVELLVKGIWLLKLINCIFIHCMGISLPGLIMEQERFLPNIYIINSFIVKTKLYFLLQSVLNRNAVNSYSLLKIDYTTSINFLAWNQLFDWCVSQDMSAGQGCCLKSVAIFIDIQCLSPTIKTKVPQNFLSTKFKKFLVPKHIQCHIPIYYPRSLKTKFSKNFLKTCVSSIRASTGHRALGMVHL